MAAERAIWGLTALDSVRQKAEWVMVDGNSRVERFLQASVDQLAIPEFRYEQAERSYNSFGDWLHRDESTVRHLDPEVYAQGSFRLGTAIRPINESEEYDVDSVGELKFFAQSEVVVGSREQASGTVVLPCLGNEQQWNLPVEGCGGEHWMRSRDDSVFSTSAELRPRRLCRRPRARGGKREHR